MLKHRETMKNYKLELDIQGEFQSPNKFLEYSEADFNRILSKS